MTGYKSREITQTLLQALRTMPVVVLTGMRQTGKSTLLQQDSAFKDRRFITLDDFTIREGAKRNPEALLSGSEPITVDEAQKCPELLTAIKRLVDKDRIPGRFLLSGSANFALLKGVSESLAGRAIYFNLHPMTRREIAGALDQEPFLRQFFRSLELLQRPSCVSIKPKEVLVGGLPPACLHTKEDPFLWFKGYEQTYLERDVRELSQVADLLSFRNVLQLSALRSGQVLKISELARDAKMNSTTASRYLNLAETSFVIHRIPPYLRNRASRLIKSPKLYFSDSGLACHLIGIEDLEGANESLRGALFETFLAQNLSAILDAAWNKARLYFWNVQGRHEVDFVIESGREVIAVEIKSSTHWDQKDLSGLRVFLETTPACKAAILAHNGIEAVQLDKKIWAIPLGLLLS